MPPMSRPKFNALFFTVGFIVKWIYANIFDFLRALAGWTKGKLVVLLHRASLVRPAPAELPQDWKVARVGGCSGAMQIACPFLIMPKSLPYRIEIGGFQFFEPATVITDYLITAVCAVLIFKLIKSARWGFILFFILQGLSTLVGGTAHGFPAFGGHVLHQVAWLLAGLAMLRLEWSIDKTFQEDSFRRVGRTLTSIKFAVYCFFIVQTDSTFLPVAINTALGMLVYITPRLLNQRIAGGQVWTDWFLAGIGMLIIPGVIHFIQYNPSAWFNGNDLNHLFIAGAMILFYYGVKNFSKHLAAPVV